MSTQQESGLAIFMKIGANNAGSRLGWISSLTASNSLPLELYSYCDFPLDALPIVRTHYKVAKIPLEHPTCNYSVLCLDSDLIHNRFCSSTSIL